MSLLQLNDSRQAIRLFAAHHRISVPEYYIDLFLIDHGQSNTFNSIQDLLKVYGFKNMLIENTFDDIDELPLPAFIQSKAGFFYLLNDGKNEDQLNLNGQACQTDYLIDNFLPYLLLAEQDLEPVTLDFVDNPVSSTFWKIIFVVAVVALICSMSSGWMATISFLGILTCLLAYGRDLFQNYSDSFFKYVCVESKFTSCEKENSINSKIMPIAGLLFFNFTFLSSITLVNINSILMYTVPIGIMALMYSIYFQFKNKKLCTLCFAIMLFYLMIIFNSFRTW